METKNNEKNNTKNSKPKEESKQPKKETNSKQNPITKQNQNNSKQINPKIQQKKDKHNKNWAKTTQKNEQSAKGITDKSKGSSAQTPKELQNKKKNNNNKNNKKKSSKSLSPTPPVLQKTQKKALTPHISFELSVEKINKLQDKGYKDLWEIGRGSYGKVYLAQDCKLNRRVAIKVIDLNRLSQMFLQKFTKVEIEIMKKLPEHQSVLTFYEIIEGKEDHLLYCAMEYCANGDLHEYIVKRHFIPERQACLWFKQIISGVQHIHKNGFAHRDLKCENLLLNDRYDIKIIDFGFCCRLRYSTTITINENQVMSSSQNEFPSETYCGSVIYASPELLKGQPYLPTKNDIWSSGVILYVMLFGYYPNDGLQLELFRQKDEHFIECPQTPEVSIECKQLVENILVNEDKRYTIDKMMKSDWFKKEWEDIGDNITITEYFERLNIPRVETTEFSVHSETIGINSSNPSTEPSI